jgi:hypothetical protein
MLTDCNYDKAQKTLPNYKTYQENKTNLFYSQEIDLFTFNSQLKGRFPCSTKDKIS